MKNARIVGLGGHLPGRAIPNSAIAEVAGTLPDDVLDGLQVQTRHWVADLNTGEHAESNSEMAAAAAQAALTSAGLEARDVDLLVVVLYRFRRLAQWALSGAFATGQLQADVVAFDVGVPNLTQIRDTQEHFDEYRSNVGKRQRAARSDEMAHPFRSNGPPLGAGVGDAGVSG